MRVLQLDATGRSSDGFADEAVCSLSGSMCLPKRRLVATRSPFSTEVAFLKKPPAARAGAGPVGNDVLSTADHA